MKQKNRFPRWWNGRHYISRELGYLNAEVNVEQQIIVLGIFVFNVCSLNLKPKEGECIDRSQSELMAKCSGRLSVSSSFAILEEIWVMFLSPLATFELPRSVLPFINR